ncbi:hypothetical protein [Bacillus cereus]|uniref:hypothetical protein n=1 Tax=Bacillus cereus TaxID=1396 RepID=UPI0011456244|nr:hypothetical protein [Bacillus cereus]
MLKLFAELNLKAIVKKDDGDDVDPVYSRTPNAVQREISKGNKMGNETKIPIKELFDCLRVNLPGKDVQDNPTPSITVHNIQWGMVQYLITIKSLAAGGTNHTAAELVYEVLKYKQRLIKNFTIDTPSVLTIQLAKCMKLSAREITENKMQSV